MQKKQVLSVKSLPTRLPITYTALAWLLLDRFNIHGWLQGVVWTLVGLLWASGLYGWLTEESVTLEDVRRRTDAIH